MSAEPVIIGCLQTITCRRSPPEALQLFDKATLSTAGDTEECYICVGKHRLFFVSKQMQDFVFGQELQYMDIDKAHIDENSNRRFLLKLTGFLPNWPEDRIMIKSDFRQQLIDRITLCWQAEYMYRRFAIKRLEISRGPLPQDEAEELHNIDLLQVHPYIKYDGSPSYRGYSFFLREGFQDLTKSRAGTYTHLEGWEVVYGYATNKIRVPPEVSVTIHVHDPMSVMDLEKDPERDDIRTVATNYRQALCDNLKQFYVMANGAYMKRLNRTSDIARWEGWELLIRSSEYILACVLFRRSFIPPLCDLSQDIAVLLRSPAKNVRYDLQEVLLDECRFIGDSLAPQCDITSKRQVYTEIIQARLNSLQLNEDAYGWLEGHLQLAPSHKATHATKFLMSIIKILESEGQLSQPGLLQSEELEGAGHLSDPILIPENMISEAQQYLGKTNTTAGQERRKAYRTRISRYLAYCIDGNILGDRFGIGDLCKAVGRCTPDNDRKLRRLIDFLLHIMPAEGQGSRFANQQSFISLMQLLQEPENFAYCEFNERVMRTLLMEGYIQTESKKKGGSQAGHYEKLLAALLNNDGIGIGLRTLLCRQILDMNYAEGGEKQLKIIVPALVQCLDASNVNLLSCATAALVNLSCNHMTTKTLLMQTGCVKKLVRQLRSKDDDLTMYSLFLLVNMTKTPQHRSIVLNEGGVPTLVDILTSSYQNLRKHKILTEVCSVVGQLCNDPETRSVISDQYPVVDCLLWISDSAETNSKLKSKIYFALRQLCGMEQNKVKVGQHIIFSALEDLGQARPDCEECALNVVLLLTTLATVTRGAREIGATLEERLIECRMMTRSKTWTNPRRFKQEIVERVMALHTRVREADFL